MEKECAICENSISKNELCYTVQAGSGEQKILCDHCFQDMAYLKKVNNTWCELVNIDGITYKVQK